MKIDIVAHQAAQAAENAHLVALQRDGWELIHIGQSLRIVNGEPILVMDWLEWLNFHVDKLIRPIRFKLSERVYNANPDYWAEVSRHGRYLPAWAVSWIMWWKYGKDSLL